MEGKERRGGAGSAAGHCIDDVIGRECGKRVVDEENDDDRLDVREGDVGEALQRAWRRRSRPPRSVSGLSVESAAITRMTVNGICVQTCATTTETKARFGSVSQGIELSIRWSLRSEELITPQLG